MFFKTKKECTHDRVSPELDAGYCPDCGKYIENKWYMTRCSCCNVKRRTIIKNNRLQPYTNYCPNCGSNSFYIEPVQSINFIDINFAVLVKEVCENGFQTKNQVWVEREEEPLRLLGLKLV